MPSPHVPQDFARRDREDFDKQAAYQRQAFYSGPLGVPHNPCLDFQDRGPCPISSGPGGGRDIWERFRIQQAARELFWTRSLPKGTPDNG